MKGWIGIDLDGTLAEFHGWKGIEDIGPPIPAMVERVKHFLNMGVEVKIFTARVSDLQPEQNERARQVICAWTKQHLGVVLEVTNAKDYQMLQLWDDRAIQVRHNLGEPVQ